MADILSPVARSLLMSRVRSRYNLSTEIKVLKALRHWGIKGWRRHAKLPGRPDFAWPKQRLVLFVDGCFWHGCPYCYRMPKSQKRFWREKVLKNQKRDRRVTRVLRRMGWRVYRIRECRLTSEQLINTSLGRILRALD